MDRIRSTAGHMHRAARLEPDLVLLDIGCAEALPTGSTTLRVGGRAVPPPTVALLLPTPSASRLIFVACDRAGMLQPGAGCELFRDDQGGAAFRMPRLDSAEAVVLRSASGRPELLRFLVRTVAPLLLGGRDQAMLAALCLALARDLGAAAAPGVQALCRPGTTLSLWGLSAAPPGDWHLLDGRRLRRLPAPVDGTLVLDGRVPPDAMLLPPGE